MYPADPISETFTLDGHTVSLETGAIARQAHGAVVVREGKTFILAAVVSAPEALPNVDFMPLTVEYREKAAAGGRIPGAYLRREGRPGTHETLTARLIDRTLRPLFPKGYHCETQVQVTVFGADPDTDLPSLALIGAAAAVHISDVPFEGPVAGLRVVRRRGQLGALGRTGLKGEELDLMVSASREGIVMVEGGASILPEAELLEALDAATAHLGTALDAIERLRERAGRPKRSVPAAQAAPVPPIDADVAAAIDDALALSDKHARRVALDAAKLAAGEGAEAAFEALVTQRLRARTLAGQRIGGRGPEDIRALSCGVGLIPSNHGSALFTRGETQALVSCTVGVERDALEFETVFGRKQQRFFLHYNFPPYSVGEARPMRGPGRREIGHGELAQRALRPVLPKPSELPFTVRLTSEITESNGSSSMATVCAGSLALMDSGVPISAPVAGIAMGLMAGESGVAILSDILGDEDHLGDMDFKVAGTAEGVTAVQLDNKLGSLDREILARALEQARRGRLRILEAMNAVLAAPRDSLPAHAPQLRVVKIDPQKVGRVIGQGGKTVQALEKASKTRIDIKDTGVIRIQADSAARLDDAARRIRSLTEDLEIDGAYVAEVVSLKDYGAFVRIGAHEGLVHVSKLAQERIDKPETVVQVGERVVIRVTGVDDQGRLQLSRKAALDVALAEAIDLN